MHTNTALWKINQLFFFFKKLPKNDCYYGCAKGLGNNFDMFENFNIPYMIPKMDKALSGIV
jgi:hypothetical protein